MVYKHYNSGNVWIADKNNEDSPRRDIIFGYQGIGSPHGHAVFLNGTEIFQRTYSGLSIVLGSAGSVYFI